MEGTRPNGSIAFTVLIVVLIGALLIPLAVQAEQTEIPRLTTTELGQMMLFPNVHVLDVRSADAWEDASLKIKGAGRLSLSGLSNWMGGHDRDQIYVFYCNQPRESASLAMARELYEKGYLNVFALKGGWDAWLKEALPTEAK